MKTHSLGVSFEHSKDERGTLNGPQNVQERSALERPSVDGPDAAFAPRGGGAVLRGAGTVPKFQRGIEWPHSSQ
jgi:hypothetical protein